jgi:UDP-2,3-diacylglucosamine pyrophosphatase LpxH
LKSVDCERLFLVGDIFDLWAMNGWNHDCTAVLSRLLKMMKNGTKVVYIPGNHDDAIRHFIPISFADEIEFVDEYIFTTATGKRLLVIHGDIFDFVSKWLSMVGTHIYDWLLRMNTFVHRLRVLLGFKTYWSLSAYMKKKTKRALSVIKNFEHAVVHYARSKGCDGAVAGHIHTAAMHDVDGMLYVNCGDWVESLTAFVEHFDGQLELIHWHDLTESQTA